MIKGIIASLLAALAVAALILVILHFAGVILWLAKILFVGSIIAAIILFIIVLAFFVVMFFALFYYMAEKKPTVKPGKYKIEEEKGKNE